MRKRNKKIVVTVVIIAALAIILVLNKNSIVRYIFHNRIFDGPPMDTKKKGLNISKIINFNFTLADQEFINSFSNPISRRSNQWRKMDMDIDGENYSVEISYFKNYFKYLRLNDINRSLSLRFPKTHFHNRIQSFDIFQVDRIDLFEQELIYKLARKLDIYVPYTEYVDFQVHYVNNGITFFKQAYDNIFLELNKSPDSIIFMMGKDRENRWKIKYLYNEYDSGRNPGIFEHLNNFFERLEAGDKHLMIKYFDHDYIARFEILRQLLGASSGFLMEDNIKFIYNTYNGKFYPILDESNLYNMQMSRKNKTFKLLRKQIKKSRLIKEKKRNYCLKLTENYEKIFSHYKLLKEQYSNGKGSSLHNRLRVKLISSYFENNVYNTLKQFKTNRLTGGDGTGSFLNETPENRKNTAAFLYKPIVTAKPGGYLDQMLLAPGKVSEKYGNLNLKFRKDNRIILKKGDYTLKESVFIPMGYVLEIEAGATIRMGPKVSFISYSPLLILGTEENPVVIKALKKKKPFGVWAVKGMGEEISVVEYLDFSGGSSAFDAGCFYTGGLNFFEMKVDLKNSRIHHNYGHYGLNVKRGMVLLENNRFYSNAVDHAVLDFCKGVVINNRFINDVADRNGDALDLNGSEFFVANNLFANFLDKGLCIGEKSKCFIYNNVIRQNRIGLASKDQARVVVMNNRFHDNTKAISAYQKKPMFGGGDVYLFGNEFKASEQSCRLDKDSQIYKFECTKEFKEKLDRSIAAKHLDEIFLIVDDIITKYKYEKNEIYAFYIADKKIAVDEKTKVIFASLPQGASTSQKIGYKTWLDETEIFIKPIFYGIRKPDRKNNREIKLENKRNYDFKDYIFHGKIKLKHKYQHNEYDLYVTTGSLPIVDIDTTGTHGIPHIIKNEPKIPCKIRIFSSNKTAHKQYKTYANLILDAQIEGRGKKWPKWKYGITLSNSYPLEGMIDSKRWVLESSFIEKSLMRSKIAFDLLEQFRKDKKRKKIAPQSRFVEVILNGRYNGVYLLTEHINKNFLGLEEYDKNKRFISVLYRSRNENANFSAYNSESYYKKDYKHFPGKRQPLEKARDPIWGWHSGFEQRYPRKKKHGEHWKPIENFTRFVALSSNQKFQGEIFQMLDRESYIDLWILTLLIDDSDGLYQNRYLARDQGKNAKWYIIPWDKDGVFGRKYNMEKRSHKKWLSTNLFERCMKIDTFRKAFKERWKKLRGTGIISGENIFKMIDQNAALLEDARKRNFARWPINYYMYPDTNDFYQEIDSMKDWIGKRIKWLNKRISLFE